MKRMPVFFAVFVFILLGCEKVSFQGSIFSGGNVVEASTNGAADAETQGDPQVFQPFVIYSEKDAQENHFIPSGFMPDGKCLNFNDNWNESCHSGKSCVKVTYDIECSKQGARWGGIYWQNPANNWGSRKGGFDLTGATKLTFWAKGDKGGERIEEFKNGGITGDYPDSDTAMIGPVILTNEWKQYTIDLRGKDLSYISGGFGWATNADVNPQSCVFYLDDLKYE